MRRDVWNVIWSPLHRPLGQKVSNSKLQGVELKVPVAGQAQHDVIGMNKSYRRLPHSVSHQKNVQSHVLNDRNRIIVLKNMFAKHCKIVINRFFDLKRILSFSMW